MIDLVSCYFSLGLVYGFLSFGTAVISKKFSKTYVKYWALSCILGSVSFLSLLSTEISLLPDKYSKPLNTLFSALYCLSLYLFYREVHQKKPKAYNYLLLALAYSVLSFSVAHLSKLPLVYAYFNAFIYLASTVVLGLSVFRLYRKTKSLFLQGATYSTLISLIFWVFLFVLLLPQEFSNSFSMVNSNYIIKLILPFCGIVTLVCMMLYIQEALYKEIQRHNATDLIVQSEKNILSLYDYVSKSLHDPLSSTYTAATFLRDRSDENSELQQKTLNFICSNLDKTQELMQERDALKQGGYFKMEPEQFIYLLNRTLKNLKASEHLKLQILNAPSLIQAAWNTLFELTFFLIEFSSAQNRRPLEGIQEICFTLNSLHSGNILEFCMDDPFTSLLPQSVQNYSFQSLEDFDAQRFSPHQIEFTYLYHKLDQLGCLGFSLERSAKDTNRFIFLLPQ